MTLPMEKQDKIIEAAFHILETRLKRSDYVSSPLDIKNYLKIKLAEEEREVFAMVLLDNRHAVLEYVELFYGTIDGASVYPRECIKTVLQHNAAAVILVHNHPSTDSSPSEADKKITNRLKRGFDAVDVRLLDHLIVGGVDEPYSFAEAGLI